MQRRDGRTHEKFGRSQKDFGCACKGYATIGTRNATFFRETLRYMVFDRHRAVQIGSERPRFSSVLNPRLTAIPCISTKNKKIAVKVTLYQNNLDSGGRGWIRTTEVSDGRFTVCSLWPLGNSSVFNCADRSGSGAGGRTRTPDLLITNQLLYQLSYTSIGAPSGVLEYYITVFCFRQEFF